MACRGLNKNKNNLNQVLQIEIPSFKVTEFPSMDKRDLMLKLAIINSGILSIVEKYNENEKQGSSCTSVGIYSVETKNWKHQSINFKGRICYCICSLINKLYIICGYVKNDNNIISSCYTYNIKTNERIDIADLNKARSCAACTIFEGKNCCYWRHY